VTKDDSRNANVEIYGPIHIWPHDYRVLYGYWGPEREEFVKKKR
jgi:hypothetical protein